MPADCQFDHRCIEEGHRNLAIGLDDLQPLDPVRPSPQCQVHIGDLASVITHVGQFVVQIVTHQIGQGDIDSDQQDYQSGQGP